MIKDVRQTLEMKGYTADEIDVLLKSFTELLDTLRKEATRRRFASRRPGLSRILKPPSSLRKCRTKAGVHLLCRDGGRHYRITRKQAPTPSTPSKDIWRGKR